MPTSTPPPLVANSRTAMKIRNGQLCKASQKNYISLYLMCVYMDPELQEILKKGFK